MRNCAPVIAALIVFAAPAHAINKCTVDGRVVFQDTPCQGEGETLRVSPAAGHAPDAAGSPAGDAAARNKAELADLNWRAAVRSAIERGEPLIGMTEKQLFQAMGEPDGANLANYNGRRHNQLIYERGGRTLYVYTDAGIVRSIQNTESIGGARRVAGPCPSATEIRAMETSASSITLSEREKVERLRQIAEARKCGQ